MLALNNWSLSYEGHEVFKNLNVQINPLQITALVGLNGSGKSSLLRSLMGLEHSATGRLEFQSQNITLLRSHQRSKYFSLLESETSPVFSISVGDLIKLGAGMHAPERANLLLNEVAEGLQLHSLLNRNALTLSSGELQRTFLAHTLMGLAPLTLLDEPFTHLDWSHQHQSIQFLKSWATRHGVGFLIALHELHWIPELAQNVLVLGKKRFLASGPAASVFADEEMRGEFAFSAQIDENPLDGTKRLTLAKRK